MNVSERMTDELCAEFEKEFYAEWDKVDPPRDLQTFNIAQHFYLAGAAMGAKRERERCETIAEAWVGYDAEHVLIDISREGEGV